MNFKKIAGLLLTMMTVWSASAISEAAEVYSESELETLLTTGGDGEVKASVTTSSPIVAAANSVVLHSDSETHSLSGSTLSFGAGSSLKLYDINVGNQLVFANGAISSLILGDRALEGTINRGITLSAINGAVDVAVDTSKGVLFNNDINVNSLTVKNGNLVVNSNVNAQSISMSAGDLQLAPNSVLSSVGDIKLSDLAKINSSGTKNGVIDASGSYIQEGIGNTVYVKQVIAKDNVEIYAGNLTADSIGSETDRVGGTYKQTNLPTNVAVKDIYADNVVISGGTLNLGQNSSESTLSAAKGVEISGGTLNLNNATVKAAETASESATLSINNAVLNITGNSSIGEYNTNKYIYSAEVGTTADTRINIGNSTGGVDSLNIAAGAGGYNLGSYLTVDIASDGVLNLKSAEGNINFAPAAKINNSGVINLESDSGKFTTTLSKINDSSNYKGQINQITGNTIINEAVYTNKYTQATGSTSISTDSSLNANEAVVVDSGVFTLNGGHAEVNVESANGEFSLASGTEFFVKGGEGNSISAANINIESNVNIENSAELSLISKPNGNINIQNSDVSILDSAKLNLVSNEGSKMSINDSNVQVGVDGSLNVDGNTNFVNTDIALSDKAVLKVDSTKGNINLDSGSEVKMNADSVIEISGAANNVSINGGINSSSKSKTGSIVKSGNGSLNINSNVYANNLTATNGITNINENVDLSGRVVIDGNTNDRQTVIVNLDDNKVLTTTDDVFVGSAQNYDNTVLNLGSGSLLQGNNVSLNATVNAEKATISASKNGAVNIGQKTTLNVLHDDNDGYGISKTTVSGQQIQVDGGSTININSGAELVYDGSVLSKDAHYNVDKNAVWHVSNGVYSNSEYDFAPGGSVLTNKGYVTINDNVMFNHSNSLYNGGAIYNEGLVEALYNPDKNAVASNISFYLNRAGFDSNGRISANPQNGGAIYNAMGADGSNGIISLGQNTLFEENIASGLGGAIYNESYGNGHDAVYISANSSFNLNKSFGNGGAIYNASGVVTFGDENSFTSNAAGFDSNFQLQKISSGGAIYNQENAIVNIGGGTLFDKNVASENGGAIYNKGTINFNSQNRDTSAVFTGNGHVSVGINNHATEKGGAIYNEGVITTTDRSGQTIEGIQNAVFGSVEQANGNKAQEGGAIYSAIADDKVFVIKDSTFQNNTAFRDGGAVYNQSGTINIQSGTKMLQNTAYENGGAIYNAAGANLLVSKNVQIGANNLGNFAKRGGAIYNDGNVVLAADKDKQISFIGNSASNAGGAIYNKSVITGAGGSSLSNVNFINNTVGSFGATNDVYGGAIYNEKGTIGLLDTLFDGNAAISEKSKGGAIYNTSNGIVTVGQNTVFSNNKAIGSVNSVGGAIANDGVLNINSGSSFVNNETDGHGGAIYNSNSGIVNIRSGVVIGGLLSEYYNKIDATAGNKADIGGGIYNDGTLNIDKDAEVYFVGNKAGNKGGALYNNSANEISTGDYNLVFYGNSATNEGGAIYNNKDTGYVNISNVSFIKNSSALGSAIYNAGSMYIDNNNYFEGNVIGSAIANEGKLTLADSFDFGYPQNSIEPNAGALHIKGDGVLNIGYDLNDEKGYSLFVQNTGYVNESGDGAVNGGGLHLSDNAVVNTTVKQGGKVVSVYENTLLSSVFSNNIGLLGGALYKDSENPLLISNTVFAGNNAIAAIDPITGVNRAAGGAIYNQGVDGKESHIIVDKNVSFMSNSSTGKGGAIYNGNFALIEFTPGYIMGSDSQGYSNVAQDAGGAIANEGTMVFSTDKTNGRSIYFKYQGGGIGSDNGNIYNGRGGALYVGQNGLINTIDANNIVQEATLQNAVFTNNESLYGGALYKDSGRYKLDVKDTQFSGNRGYRDGGAVYNNNGELNFKLSSENSNIFVGNQAGNDMSDIASAGRGGAIYNAGVMDISLMNKDADAPEEVFLSNTATGLDGKGGAIYNAADLTINGNIVFSKNAAVMGGAIASSGRVVLDISDGDIIFNQNIADIGSAIYLDGGQLTITAADNSHAVTFNDSDPTEGIVAQTIASSGAAALAVRGGQVNFFSDASGYGGSYYQTGGIVTVKNKFLSITDSSIRTVTGGSLILDQGAELSTDYLLISNVETDSDNSAKIIFNKNDKASLTDLSALYENTASNNSFTYGNADAAHKISFRAADVEINDIAEIKKDSVIGNAKNTYAVRNLTLSNGAKLDANIKVYGGTTASDVGADLTLNEGALGSANAGVDLKGYNSKLNINNSKTDIVLGGKIANDGPAYGSEINKSGNGKVLITGDASGYNGKYTQDGGIVEFTSGSKFFGAKTTTKDPITQKEYITNGTLRINDGVEFEDGTVISLGGQSTFSTSKESTVDLTGENSTVLTMSDPSVRVDLRENTTLEVASNSSVNAQKDEIRIGNANLQINSIILGGADQSGKNVKVNINPNTRFILQNDKSVDGVGGILGFGDNVVFQDNDGNSVVPTVQLKDNTQLKLTNSNDSSIALKVQSIDNDENLNSAWNAKNGDIVKENKGKVTLGGDVSDFHGSLVIRDGELATESMKFNSDVVYDLSGIKDEARAKVSNVTYNDDVVIAGDISSEVESGKYELNIANDRGSILVYDAASNKYGDVNVKNGSTATFKSKSGIYMNDLNISDSTVNLAQGNMFVGGNVSMGSTFNMMNGAINTQAIAGNMTLTGNSNYLIDINPIANQADKVVINGNLSSSVPGEMRSLNIADYNLLNDPAAEYSVYQVFDVKGSINDVVFTSSSDGYKSTPIANYLLKPMGNNGSYMLSRLGFTPSVLATPVAMQGAFLTQLASYDAAFANMDTVMTLPVVGYQGNKYADANPDDTIVYSPLFIPELEKGMWFRPYGTFEKVDLDNGPSIDNQLYGAMVGGDTPLKELGHGFLGNMSAYVGYNGAHQSFGGVSNYQNGGMVGVSGAVYKGGFFSGLTVNANAGFNNSSTLYGNNDFFMLSAGVASKTGYNWELARGRFILQPSWLMSYSFVNAFSPENIAGRKIDADALNAIQLAPGLKLIANLPYGWQPYLTFNYRFNLGDETSVKAGFVELPELSVKSYVEYGLGMQKRWGNRFTGFGQVLARNIDRTGVGLNLGLRWNFGKGR